MLSLSYKQLICTRRVLSCRTTCDSVCLEGLGDDKEFVDADIRLMSGTNKLITFRSLYCKNAHNLSLSQSIFVIVFPVAWTFVIVMQAQL
jgi:hypothetical protein